MRSPISTADLLRAFAELAPETAAEKRAIAQVLGLDWKAPVQMQQIAVKPPAEPLAGRPAPPPEPSTAIAPPPPPSPVATARAVAEEISITVSGPFLETGSLLWSPPTQPFEATRPTAPAAPPASLFTPRWTRAIVSTALAERSATGPPDIRAIVEAIGRGGILRRLPRLTAPTMAQRVEVLVDVGDSMLPFAADQRDVVEAVQKVAGFDRVRALKFVRTPLEGAGTDEMDEWPSIYSFPPPRTHVLLLTDFGIGRPPLSTTSAGADEWRRFGRELRRRRIGCTAFVPYPAKRWPTGLAGHFRPVEWDRATTAGIVRFARRGESA